MLKPPVTAEKVKRTKHQRQKIHRGLHEGDFRQQTPSYGGKNHNFKHDKYPFLLSDIINYVSRKS